MSVHPPTNCWAMLETYLRIGTHDYVLYNRRTSVSVFDGSHMQKLRTHWPRLVDVLACGLHLRLPDLLHGEAAEHDCL